MGYGTFFLLDGKHHIPRKEFEFFSEFRRHGKKFLINLLKDSTPLDSDQLEYVFNNLPEWIQKDRIPKAALLQEAHDNEGNHIIHCLLNQLLYFELCFVETHDVLLQKLKYIESIQKSVQLIAERNVDILTVANTIGLQPFYIACQFGDTLIRAHRILQTQGTLDFDLVTYFVEKIKDTDIKSDGLKTAKASQQVETQNLLSNLDVQLINFKPVGPRLSSGNNVLNPNNSFFPNASASGVLNLTNGSPSPSR